MSNQVFHYSNVGVSSGQRFYLKDEVSGIFLNKLNINSDSNIVAKNLVYNTGDQTISGVKAFVNGIIIVAQAPTYSNSFGVSGSLAFDNNFFYRHNGTLWNRVALASF